MLITTTPGAFLWPAAMIVWGPGSASSPHRHRSVQLIMAIAGSLRVREAAEAPWVRFDAALIRPDATHEVDASGTSVLIAFVDPES
jgi:quercetin dioxygenase-like cupin family protein